MPSFVRLLVATLVTLAIAALVIASGEFRPLPPNIAGCAVVLLAWALALRWRIVAGASIGLLAWAVIPMSLHVPDLGGAVVFIVIGAILGFALSEETPRKTKAEAKQ